MKFKRDRLHISLLLLVFLLAPSINAATRIGILGDRTGGANQDVFDQVVDELILLHPDVLINVGDLIEGPQPDAAAINREWDVVMDSMNRFKCPVYYVAGNNDVFDETSRELYVKRTGFELDYSFDFNGIHFIVLDNSCMKNWDQMSEERFVWLEKDLAGSTSSLQTIVVFHKPFWLESVERGSDCRLHPLFLKYGVDRVFSGHYHRYIATEIDGIQYVMIGSSGGHKGDNHYRGEYYHYGWLTVDDDISSCAVIESGNIVDQNWLTYEHWLAQDVVNRDLLELTAPVISSTSRRCATTLRFNPVPDVTGVYYQWNTQGTQWIISPEKGAVDLSTGSKVQDCAVLIPDVRYPLPELEISTSINGRPYKMSTSLTPRVQIPIQHIVHEDFAVDGSSGDSIWSKSCVAKLNQFGDESGGKCPTDPLEVKVVLNGDRLCFLIEAKSVEPLKEPPTKPVDRDGPVFMDDCVYLMFWSSDSTPTFTQIVVNCHGGILDQQGQVTKRSPYYRPEMDSAWNANLKHGFAKMPDGWVTELSVPLEDLGILSTENTIYINVLRYQPSTNGLAQWQVPATYYPEDAGQLKIVQ